MILCRCSVWIRSVIESAERLEVSKALISLMLRFAMRSLLVAILWFWRNLIDSILSDIWTDH